MQNKSLLSAQEYVREKCGGSSLQHFLFSLLSKNHGYRHSFDSVTFCDESDLEFLQMLSETKNPNVMFFAATYRFLKTCDGFPIREVFGWTLLAENGVVATIEDQKPETIFAIAKLLGWKEGDE